MEVVYNGLARTELSANIQNLFASSFYEAIESKLSIFIFSANSLGGVIYGDLFWETYVNESGVQRFG